MRWRKLGRVYVPDGSVPWMTSHAGVPFAEPLDGGGVRILFTARDARGRSQIGSLELDPERPKEIRAISPEPLLALGPLGTFDESGTMASWLVESGGTRFLYYTGWSLAATVPFRNAVGLATSVDGGRTYTKVSRGPVVDRSIHDPCFTSNPCVHLDEGRWRMWYISCVAWEASGTTPRHSYHIKYGESVDGVEWRRHGTIAIDFAGPDEYAISRPCVVRDKDVYRMWYSYRGDRYRIGYAESEDGIRWTRKDAEAGIAPSDSGWDSEMIEYPHVFDHGSRRYMLYNGNGYGRTGFGLALLER